MCYYICGPLKWFCSCLTRFRDLKAKQLDKHMLLLHEAKSRIDLTLIKLASNPISAF